MMKHTKYKLILIVGGAILIFAILLNSTKISNMMARVYFLVAKSRIINADPFWFSHADIDSLYKEKKYKYFMFVRESMDKNLRTLAIPQDSILIIKNSNHHFPIMQNFDTISLPESALNLVLKDEETTMLCLVEYVVQAPKNRYKIRRIE